MRIEFIFMSKSLAVSLRVFQYCLVAGILLVTGSCYYASKKLRQNSPNTILKSSSLTPIKGPPFKLSELKNAKALVIVMRERGCPISEKYGPRLVQLEEDYSKKEVKFIYNYVGQVRAEKNAKKDLEKFNFKSPYVIDADQKIIKALGAKTTGDVFIFNSDRKVIYKGPVDDQFHLLRSAIKAKNHYVRDILDKLVSNQKVVPKELPAPGCIISPPVKKKSFLGI